jgi:hypothetical protein
MMAALAAIRNGENVFKVVASGSCTANWKSVIQVKCSPILKYWDVVKPVLNLLNLGQRHKLADSNNYFSDAPSRQL